jgi:hypothetical protein
MPLTNFKGVLLEYWAVSSFGDESPHLFLPLRNFIPGDQPNLYRFEVLADAWAANALPGAVRWRMFPTSGDPIGSILDQPDSANNLETRRTYHILASKLIQNGMVDAGACPGRGLFIDQTATDCGVEHALEQILFWQNKYDNQILSAARQYDIPARLLKAIIARETQFWPVSQSPYELGLGRVTENGADLLLNWDVGYFLNDCATVYGEDACAGGFGNLSDGQKTILRARALSAVGKENEISLIASVFKASSSQVTQMIRNVTQRDLADSASLEEIWKISVGNYHSGSGCIALAMNEIPPTIGDTITWQEIADHLTPACATGRDYVDEVIELAQMGEHGE